MQQVKPMFFCFFLNQGCIVICFSPHVTRTRLVLDIQGDLEALIHELHNLHKVSFFELSGGQGWSTWYREEHRYSSFTLHPASRNASRFAIELLIFMLASCVPGCH